MKHIELHVIAKEHDVDLVNIAGLLDNELLHFDTICNSCTQLIRLGDGKEFATIVLTDTVSKLSCETCLTDVIQAVILN
jgi:hypothetical protein